jgi:hypothetical protein
MLNNFILPVNTSCSHMHNFAALEQRREHQPSNKGDLNSSVRGRLEGSLHGVDLLLTSHL